jgi:hypothetical protein
VNAVPQDVPEIFLHAFLEANQVGRGRFGHPSAVERPALVRVINLNNVPLREVLRSRHVRRFDIILKSFESFHLARMPELAQAPAARHVPHIQIRASAHGLDCLLQQLLRFCRALFRHQHLRLLR